MGDRSKIHWLEDKDGVRGSTWNPVTGCSWISSECDNCYAKKQAERMQKMGVANYKDGFAVRCHDHMLEIPLKWSRSRNIFVCSMSDLFHPEVPMEFIQKVYCYMTWGNQHRYQVLTKRPARMHNIIRYMDKARMRHIWHGVSVGDRRSVMRIDELVSIPDINRFVSFEPLIETVSERSDEMVVRSGDGGRAIDWVIIGGESGPNARPMNLDAAHFLVSEYRSMGTKVFFKQMGSAWAKARMSKTPKGDDPSEWPEWARIREFPW